MAHSYLPRQAVAVDVGKECNRCQVIIKWLQNREQGRRSKCPICGDRYYKGKQWVLDIAGMPVNEKWQESDRPAYCGICNWSGKMKETVRLEDEVIPFRCPVCRSWVANKVGEE
jgi:hypothetical protein